MTVSKALENIYYINIPDSLNINFENFNFDKKIKLPIETDSTDSWNENSISWEKIISAMLKILAYNQDHKNIDYFRDFVFAIKPNIVQELTDSAIFKSNENNFNLAKEIFLAITGLEPENTRNILNLAVLYENEAEWYRQKNNNEMYYKNLELSKEIYTDLLDRDTILSDVYFNSGFFFIKIREFDKAETCLKSFIEYSDDDEKIEIATDTLKEYKSIIENEDFFNNVYNLILQENEYKAIEIINEFLSTNNSVWNAWFLQGWAYRRLFNFSEAKISLQKALELNPKDIDTLNELAICQMELGDLQGSKKSLEKALTQTPEDVKIISNLGIIQLKLGNRDEAIKYFESVLVYYPQDNIAQQYLQEII